ncbi:MAG: XdhC/CoxI family protein [Anaerolineaceae bacterium]|nr:XdhC/CoxI family protein [Anaerolineaceae bacterium]
MRDILPVLEEWSQTTGRIALATVMRTWGSSPRGVGAKMALTPDGKIAGSVSGGCVEGAVFETGLAVLTSGVPQLVHFGVADETAWSVGLACGGQLDVFIRPLDPDVLPLYHAAFQAGKALCTAIVVRGPQDWFGKELLVSGGQRLAGGIDPALDDAIIAQAGRPAAGLVDYETRGGPIEVFFDVVAPQPVLVIVGGAHTSIPLANIARTLDYYTVVVDPRRAFGNAERFPDVDRLLQAWPQDVLPELDLGDNTAIAVLTHDPKIDDPALVLALQSQAFYVGALGSPTTQAARRQRLLAAGVPPEQLARIHGPIGLKLGSDTPQELALAIMAEIVAARHGALVKTQAAVGVAA